MKSVARVDPDTASIDGIVRALYEVISGPAGAPRDWNRERKLFYPGAKLAPTRPGPGGGGIVDFFDVEGYIASRSPMFEKDSFFETEVARREFVFGNIAHVLPPTSSRAARRPALHPRRQQHPALPRRGPLVGPLIALGQNERAGNPSPTCASSPRSSGSVILRRE